VSADTAGFLLSASAKDVALHPRLIPSFLTVSPSPPIPDTVKHTMSLTDTFVKQVKPIKPNGDKYADGGGMYLFVKATGKYWRLDYRHLNKRKTLALGAYPEVSLAKARKRREEARELLADGIDPAQSKRDMKQAQIIASGNTFEIVARQWLSKRQQIALPPHKRKSRTGWKVTCSRSSANKPFQPSNHRAT